MLLLVALLLCVLYVVYSNHFTRFFSPFSFSFSYLPTLPHPGMHTRKKKKKQQQKKPKKKKKRGILNQKKEEKSPAMVRRGRENRMSVRVQLDFRQVKTAPLLPHSALVSSLSGCHPECTFLHPLQERERKDKRAHFFLFKNTLCEKLTQNAEARNFLPPPPLEPPRIFAVWEEPRTDTHLHAHSCRHPPPATPLSEQWAP